MQYFTSDIHAYHKNIAKGTSTWNDGHRDFKNAEEMTQHIIQNINKTVKHDDVLYYLGDWSFGNISNIFRFWNQLHCKNIHYIFGNHDQAIEENKILPNCHSVFPFDKITEGPATGVGASSVYAQQLFKSVEHLRKEKINGQKILMCHYAMRVWDRSHRGSWMLYGHSHDTLWSGHSKNKETQQINKFYEKHRTMDVGVDSAYRILGSYRPFSFTEIKEIIETKIDTSVDHHGEDTND